MAGYKKLSKRPSIRDALIRNQVTALLWNGKVETTLARAKAVQRVAEKIITLAMNTYKDTVTVEKDVVVDGVTSKKQVINDGPKKLAARRSIMAQVYDVQEVRAEKESKADFVERTKDIKHPIMEKIFNVIAPKYDLRREELGQGGGYTRIVKCGPRRGDGAERVILTLV
ncbi:MAG: 50S ribosomal protein L17 [Clostridia bacterium]|nr:50S ribosomal protein L17 [Clostridia bacterium]